MKLHQGVVVVCLALGSPRAFAQDAKATALRLFDEAGTLLEQGHVKEACAKYAESQRVQAQLGTLLHLADCQERAGMATSAWSNFREAVEIAQQRGDRRASVAAERAKALASRVSRVRVVVAESARVAGLQISMNGAPVASELWGTVAPIDAGPIEVVAEAAGHRTWKRTLTLKEGGEETVEVPLLESNEPASPAPPRPSSPVAKAPAEPTEKPATGGSAVRTAGWIVAGVGVAGLGVSTLFWLQRNSKLDQRDKVCPSHTACTEDEADQLTSLTDDAKGKNTLGLVSFIAGGALAVGGVAMVLLAPHAKSDGEKATLAKPWLDATLGRDGGKVVFRGSF